MTAILVIGVAVADFVFQVEALPQGARKFRAQTAEIVGGGCAANAAVAIARLGGEAHLGARMGDDQMGDVIVADLQAEGVHTALVQRTPNARSSFSSIYVDGTGERQIMNFRGAGLTQDVAWITDAPPVKAVLADTRWTKGAIAALDMARARGVPGVVDAENPMEHAVLAHASHVAFSRDGLQSYAPGPDLPTALAQAADRLDTWAAVTDGANGVWYTTPGGIDHIPAFPITVRDTTGAGDVWHGAFTLALAEGQSEPQAIRFANATAAIKCQTFGGRNGCPDRPELNDFLKEFPQ